MQENSVDEVSPAYTILPKNRKYISTLGQRSQLSFYDIKTVNEAYCSGKFKWKGELLRTVIKCMS